MNDAQPETQALETLGRYHLLRKLGQGGMGAVFLAHDTKLDRRVAVKILPPHAVNDPDAVARFQREAKALAKLSHACIVQAFDCDSAGDRHFLVMEYVEGDSLAGVLKENGPLQPTVAADYIHQAATALQHAHTKGLIHRDLKPSNLLLTGDGHVKLLDLGLARFLQDQIGDPELTRENTGMGTPDYAAPEQFRDAHHADARSDIYSLGCTLYHLLTGQVPFPGSSWQDKYQAHQFREPAPIRELCPGAPAGLVLAVEKMMAKRPEDRFQTAQEVSDALAPCVAGSSVSFQAARQTMTFQRTLNTLTMPQRRQKIRWALVGAVLATAVSMAVFVILPWFLTAPPDGDKLVQRETGKDTSPGAGPGPAKQPAGDKGLIKQSPEQGAEADPKVGKKDVKPPAPADDDPNVLTVAQDGTGKFKTITAALNEVKPGQIIRVLDDRDYEENLALRTPAAEDHITLEAIRAARLLCTGDHVPAIKMEGVAGVTVRGFRLKAEGKKIGLIALLNGVKEILLEDLIFEAGHASYTAVEVWDTSTEEKAAPIVVRRCTFHKPMVAVSLNGKTHDGLRRPTARVVIQENQVHAPVFGFFLADELLQLQVVGNQVVDAGMAGVFVDMRGEQSRDVLIANNTLANCRRGLLVRMPRLAGKNFRINNNLLLGCPNEDICYLISGNKSSDPNKGPGDGKELAGAWHFSHNWREVLNPPAPGSEADKCLVPPGTGEKRLQKIDDLNLDPKSPDYLRPAADSPLAKEGAGGEDPSLPFYIGARPPRGQPAWDWSRTWQVWPPGKLLTVSKDSAGGGKYRSLTAALKDAGPWTTIRVLDKETYKEQITLDKAAQFIGLQLEALQGATVQLQADSTQPWVIKDVPHVRLRGFQFEGPANAGPIALLLLSGHTPGCVVEQCQFTGALKIGITVSKPQNGPKEMPLVIRHNAFPSIGEGIVVKSPLTAAGQPGGVLIANNRVCAQYRGIVVQGQLHRVLVYGNKMVACGASGLQVEDAVPASNQIWFVNNTAADCEDAFRLWMNHGGTQLGRVGLLNNLLSDASACDICARSKGEPSPSLAKDVLQQWVLAGNARDFSGDTSAGQVPLGGLDLKIDTAAFVTRVLGETDFLRPTPATWEALKSRPQLQGLLLPPYVGAVPPPGVEPWVAERLWGALGLEHDGSAKGNEKR